MKPLLPILVLTALAAPGQTVITNEVQAVRLTLRCEKCGGEMVHDGVVLTSSPAQYPHRCTSCKTNTVTISGSYFPRIEFIAKSK